VQHFNLYYMAKQSYKMLNIYRVPYLGVPPTLLIMVGKHPQTN
jgi:hypothetical protein